MKYSVPWLIHKFDSNEALKYLFFWGHTPSDTIGKFVFSQWHDAPFIIDNITYPTAEHYMMAQKALLFNDQITLQKIIAAKKPGEAKELGRQVKDFDASLWDQKKYEIVVNGNFHKFNQHPALRDYLIATGDRVLVEASPVDTVWGIGLTADHKMIENPHTWRGENLLGFALMEVRDRI